MSFFAPNLPWLQPSRPHAEKAARPFSTIGLSRLVEAASAFWRRVSVTRQARLSTRRLQVIEKVHLGDKQFIALLELDGQTILASGAPGAALQISSSLTLRSLQERPKPERIHEEVPVSAPPKGAGKPRKSQGVEAPAVIADAASSPGEVPAAGITLQSARPASLPSPAAETSRKAVSRKTKKALPPAHLAEAKAMQPEEDDAAPVPDLRLSPATAAPESTLPPPKRAGLAALVQPASASAAPTAQAGRRKASAAPMFLAQQAAAPAATEPKPRPEPRPEASQTAAPDPKVDMAFAALLQLRMLATQVFEEIQTQPDPLPPPPPKPSRLARRLSLSACFLAIFFLPHASAHASALPSILAAVQPAGNDIHITGLGGSSAPWAIVVVLTLLSLIPSLLFCVTPFARLLIVFHFLRQALGLQTTPSNQTLIGLSLILTFFLMQPTAEVIYRDAILPVQAGKLTPLDGVVRAGEPMRHFMAHYVREKDAELFLEIAHEPKPRTVGDMSFRVLLPAYILSELKAGFQIGTVLFLPFLIVDMVVASITTSVGMVQLPPVVISTPLKLLLFLMVDGWHLLIGSLMRSFN